MTRPRLFRLILVLAILATGALPARLSPAVAAAPLGHVRLVSSTETGVTFDVFVPWDLLALEPGLPQAPHDADFEPAPFEAGGWPGSEIDSRTHTWGASPLPAAGDTEAADLSAMPDADVAEPAAIAEALVAPQADSCLLYTSPSPRDP